MNEISEVNNQDANDNGLCTDDASLLPANATLEENALAQTYTRTTQIPVELGQLWDPQTCPQALLPWLAWALSIDEWDSDWSEATQRAVIQQSARVHRHKGTVGAVKNALASLDVRVDFLEWFQEVDDIALVPVHSKTPHTFVFIAWANEYPYTSHGIFLNPELYATVQRVVAQVKPTRSHFNFLVGAKLNLDVALGVASTGWLQSGRFSNETQPVQIAPLCTSLGAALHINNKRYAVGRFYCQ